MHLPRGSQAPPALWRRDSAQPWGSQSPMVGDWGALGVRRACGAVVVSACGARRPRAPCRVV